MKKDIFIQKILDLGADMELAGSNEERKTIQKAVNDLYDEHFNIKIKKVLVDFLKWKYHDDEIIISDEELVTLFLNKDN